MFVWYACYSLSAHRGLPACLPCSLSFLGHLLHLILLQQVAPRDVDAMLDVARSHFVMAEVNDWPWLKQLPVPKRDLPAKLSELASNPTQGQGGKTDPIMLDKVTVELCLDTLMVSYQNTILLANTVYIGRENMPWWDITSIALWCSGAVMS